MSEGQEGGREEGREERREGDREKLEMERMKKVTQSITIQPHTLAHIGLQVLIRTVKLHRFRLH